MSSKDDKWVMFRNFMVNELGITKEDIRTWINDAVAEEAKKIVAESFERTNPEQMIRNAIREEDYFGNSGFSTRVTTEVAKILADNLKIVSRW